MLPGMWVKMVRLWPDTSNPLTVPLSTCHDNTPSQVPKSGSSPTQHGQSVLHVHTSSKRPSSWYVIALPPAKCPVDWLYISSFSKEAQALHREKYVLFC